MKLSTIKRKAQHKSQTNQLRVKGYIPANLYHNGKPGETIAIKDAEYQAIIREVKPGHLSTQKIALVDEAGKEIQAIVKEIQYHPVSYRVLHIDFEQLDENVPVNVKVPLECTGVIDCVGVKLGGNLRQILRHMKIRCLPRDIPQTFSIDISNMGINESRRLSDFHIPNNVRPLMSLNEVAIVIGKR